MLGSLNSRMRLLNANDHNKWQWSRLTEEKKNIITNPIFYGRTFSSSSCTAALYWRLVATRHAFPFGHLSPGFDVHHHRAYEAKQFLLNVPFKWFAMQSLGCFVVVGQLISCIQNCQVSIEDNSMMRYVHLTHTIYRTRTISTTTPNDDDDDTFVIPYCVRLSCHSFQMSMHFECIANYTTFKAENRIRK